MTRKAAEFLHGGKIDQFVLQNFIGRMRVVDHLPFGIVPDDGRAAETFEDADLDFLRIEGDETIESGGKIFDAFAGQANDEVGVDMNACLLAQEMEIVLEAGVILATFDERADGFVERLNANFELQRAGRKTGNHFAQRGGQAVGDHFEVVKMAGLVALKKEFKDGFAGRDVEVESAVHELELLNPALKQAREMIKQAGQGELAYGDVQ